MKVFGYVEEASFPPGAEVACMISAPGPVAVDVVRLLHGDRNPAGPGFRVEPVDLPPRVVPCRVQDTHPGSCLRAESVVPPGTRTLRVSLLVWPTLPAAGGPQGLVGLGPDLSLGLDEGGHLRLWAGAERARLPRPLLDRRWYRITAEFGVDGVDLTATPLHPIPGDDERMRAVDPEPVDLTGVTDVVVAAAWAPVDRAGRPRPRHGYNGKVERPVLGTGDVVLAEWAFDLEPHGDRVVDVSGRDRHATLVNQPARAMTGHDWTGEVSDCRAAPEQYGAIHFHDDDLSDARWDVSTRLRLPDDLRSGVYAVRLRGFGETDHVPFVVRPRAPRSDTVFLVPTYTYLAYANERTAENPDTEAAKLTDQPIVADPHDLALREHPEFGLSLYDLHRDGSGVSYSTWRRPLLTLRPDYRMWLCRAPRHLGADLYLVDWLEHFGLDYDVVSDHDLDADPDLLESYRVVLTGSHPEYHSQRMLDALRRHTEHGGRLMYLGGNGFYWVTSRHAEHTHLIEVRRSSGVRSWEIRPGEGHHSTTGEPGGLWRWRGRPPNALVGVGMTAQGWGDRARGYRRTPESHDPRYSWVFEGIADEVLGDFGLVMGGASGDELDRCDPALGSPPQTVVLASSLPHSDFYQLAVEDVFAITADLTGSTCPRVRSDLVLLECSGGGAVLSVGSISFLGSLSHNDYRNSVSRLVHNVLTAFRHPGPVGRAPAESGVVEEDGDRVSAPGRGRS
ncbi:N,N-dimethylformamidase beta subunit family domain-containing protein [Actinosynnema sp. NPDC020468]|uniref:N,N-dimethylformamidase beta subunit family domain-containing protein n=1 Tax=Actinosynnema sp. NPDC020468 TaxID=3154488 RepID=UPI0033F92B0F